MPTQNLAIMFTDIKGFTERTSASTREGMMSLLAEHEKLLVPVFEHFDGSIVKTIGDAFLVTFGSPTDAVLCGVTIQEVLRQHNAAADEGRRLDVRVAINVGEVERSASDVLGEPVNIAARLEGVAEAGEVWFTDAVYQTMNRSEVPSADVGEKVFKGIPYPVRVYRVIDEPGSDLSLRLAKGVQLSERGPVFSGIRDAVTRRPRSRGPRRLAIAGAVAVAVVAAGAFLLLPSGKDRAISQANAQLAAGSPAAALETLNGALASRAADADLTRLALAAATAELDRMVAAGEYRQAFDWLSARLVDRPYLAALRPRLVELDAHVAVESALADPKLAGQYYPKSLKEFLARHANDASAPYLAAQLLATRGEPMTRLWLQRQALDAGYPALDAIFSANIAWQEQGPLDWQLLDASRELLQTHYAQRTRDWAATAIDGGGVLAFQNAWRVLEAAGDARLTQDPYAALHALIGAGDTDTATAALARLKRETDPARRQRIAAFVAELVDTFPRHLNSGDVRDLLKAARGEFAGTL